MKQKEQNEIDSNWTFDDPHYTIVPLCKLNTIDVMCCYNEEKKLNKKMQTSICK